MLPVKDHSGGGTDKLYLLRVEADILWHWDVLRNIDAYNEIDCNSGALTQPEFLLYAGDQACVVEDQPTWDMGDFMATAPADALGSMRDAFRPCENKAARRLPPRCRQWRMKQFAFYTPAHLAGADQYGIHLSRRGVAHVVRQVHALCPGQPLEIIKMATVYMLYAHELAHAWIEDIVCMSDFEKGERKPKGQRRFVKVSRQYHGYIFMEEALCSTAAFGSLHAFLFDRSDRLPSMPPFDAEQVLAAFEQWMRLQPRGYRDFIAIRERPDQSAGFIRNLLRLLLEVYQLYSDEYASPLILNKYTQWRRVAQLIDAYFACYIGPALGDFRSKASSGMGGMWKMAPPIHLEP